MERGDPLSPRVKGGTTIDDPVGPYIFPCLCFAEKVCPLSPRVAGGVDTVTLSLQLGESFRCVLCRRGERPVTRVNSEGMAEILLEALIALVLASCGGAVDASVAGWNV